MMSDEKELLAGKFKYDPLTGKLHWRVSTHSRKGVTLPGDEAGTHNQGYIQVKVAGRAYRAHRVAWLLMTGNWPPTGQEIDHINGVRDDNKWANLRLVTRSQNNMNIRQLSERNKSGVRGVSKAHSKSNKWRADIQVNKQQIALGCFDSFDEAVAARRSAERARFGKYSPFHRVRLEIP